MITSPALVQLLHLASPTLPVGNFAYSQGIEQLHDEGLLSSEGECLEYLRGFLQGPMTRLDGPVFELCRRAIAEGRHHDFRHCNALLLAARETWELQQEEKTVGRSLQALLPTLLGDDPQDEAALPVGTHATFTGVFALICARQGVEAHAALTAFLWAWLEARVAAATKIIPLGQTAAQRLLVALTPDLPAVAAAAIDRSEAPDRIGFSTPGLAHASAAHETQYTRLFLS